MMRRLACKSFQNHRLTNCYFELSTTGQNNRTIQIVPCEQAWAIMGSRGLNPMHTFRTCIVIPHLSIVPLPNSGRGIEEQET